MGSITARVQARPGEADKPTRQDAYLRALGTLPGVTMGLLSPTALSGRHPSRQLIRHADFIKRIRKGVLKDSLLPDPVVGPHGPIRKLRGW
jgi:hypothetical protein